MGEMAWTGLKPAIAKQADPLRELLDVGTSVRPSGECTRTLLEHLLYSCTSPSFYSFILGDAEVHFFPLSPKGLGDDPTLTDRLNWPVRWRPMSPHGVELL